MENTFHSSFHISTTSCPFLNDYSLAFQSVCLFLFPGGFCSTLGNSIFNAVLVLTLPEDKRGVLSGFLNAACTGGSASSAVIYGLLCDIFPLPMVFIIGTALSIPVMAYLCFHKSAKAFILEQ